MTLAIYASAVCAWFLLRYLVKRSARVARIWEGIGTQLENIPHRIAPVMLVIAVPFNYVFGWLDFVFVFCDEAICRKIGWPTIAETYRARRDEMQLMNERHRREANRYFLAGNFNFLVKSAENDIVQFQECLENTRESFRTVRERAVRKENYEILDLLDEYQPYTMVRIKSASKQ